MADSWHALLATSIEEMRDEPHFVQFATVTPQGLPQVRTLVCRNVDDEGSLYFTTDGRSAKIAELNHNSSVQACWYFARSREQYRFTASASWQCGEVAQPMWQKLSEATQQTFYSPTPGLPVARGGISTYEAFATPPEDFCVLKLTVSEVDYLSLTPSPHERILFTKRAGEWASQHVAP